MRWNAARACQVLCLAAPLILAGFMQASAQQDTLVFKNGDVMVGEIKSMDRGVAVVSTDYSDADFKVSWVEVARVFTTTTFLVMRSYDRRHYGSLHSTDEGRAQIRIDRDSTVEVFLDEIVYLSPIEENFLDRLSASIDLGFSLTKANNLRQLSTRSTIGYRVERWSIDIALNSLSSSQTDVEPTQRTEGSLNYRYILPAPWYSVATVSALTNTEQKLDLRLNAQLAGARFFLRTNSAYLGMKIGLNRNIERYSSETDDRSTWEGLMGAELNLYGGGDLELLASVAAYPSFSEKGRWRADINTDLKYDLPFDFYINLGVSFNYDNRPAEGASETDYVLQSGFGWEW
jgi:hypothetical protein